MPDDPSAVFDRELTVVEIELDELIRGDENVRVRAVDVFDRDISFVVPGHFQPRIGQKVRVQVSMCG